MTRGPEAIARAGDDFDTRFRNGYRRAARLPAKSLAR